MASIFSRIVAGEIPSFKVAEDENFYAFLDAFPLVKGHTLIVPKVEIDYIFDLDEDLYIKYQLFAKKIAHAIKKAIPCKKVGMAVVGLEVPHAHIHLVPMNALDDLNFSRTKLQLPKEEMEEIAGKIRKEL